MNKPLNTPKCHTNVDLGVALCSNLALKIFPKIHHGFVSVGHLTYYGRFCVIIKADINMKACFESHESCKSVLYNLQRDHHDKTSVYYSLFSPRFGRFLIIQNRTVLSIIVIFLLYQRLIACTM